jgi:RHS repeat-associated protein
MLDDQRRVVGEGSMDPFGAVNRVSLNSNGQGGAADTPHPYPKNANQMLADFRQPLWSSSTAVRIRARFGLVDTESNGGTALDGVTLSDGDTGQVLTSALVGGHHAGRMTSGWVTPSAGRLKAMFTSNGSSCCPTSNGALDCSAACTSPPAYTGVSLEGYEYQRYQTGASPAWLPLRYPGQYWDAETGLSQNWNRFYEASTGRFVQAEPELETPQQVIASADAALVLPAYTSAGGNPISRSVPDGRNPSVAVGISLACLAQPEVCVAAALVGAAMIYIAVSPAAPVSCSVSSKDKRPKLRVVQGGKGADPYKWDPNKENCMGACAMGGPALDAFCRVLANPSDRGACFRVSLLSTAECMNMCRSIF